MRPCAPGCGTPPVTPSSKPRTRGPRVRGSSRGPARRDQRLRRAPGAAGSARQGPGSACGRHRARPRVSAPRRHRGPAGHGRARRHPSGGGSHEPPRSWSRVRRPTPARPIVTTGLCRALARRGVRVAPSRRRTCRTTRGVRQRRSNRPGPVGAGTGGTSRAGVAMNPVLLKPGGDRRSTSSYMGQPAGELASRISSRKRASPRVAYERSRPERPRPAGRGGGRGEPGGGGPREGDS